MYSNGYVPQPPQQRHRRGDRYAPQGDQASPQGWQQPGYAQPARPAPAPQMGGYPPPAPPAGPQNAPRQGIPPVAQPLQQGYQPQQPKPYGRYYQPEERGNPQWSRPQARYEQTNQQQPLQGFHLANVPQGQQPPVKDGGHGGENGGPQFNWRVLLIAVVLVLVLGLGGMAAHRAYEDRQLKQYVAGFDAVFCNNVYVDGLHLGGMTQQQAITAVTEKARERNDAWYVQLTYQGKMVYEFRADQLGMTVDVTEQLRQAWEQGHTGDAYQRLAAMEQLAQTPYQAYSALPNGDTSVVDGILEQIKNKVYMAPQDAAIVAFDPNRVTDPFDITDERVGYSLDTEPIKEKIYQMVSTMESGQIEIVPTPIQPQTTRAQLEKLVTLRASASTKISTTSTENRTNNIKRAFQLINGTIIQPGATFSFNNVVGERSTENGFFEAIEYAYNEQVMGIGGGVCQASSTLYQAAVAAGMEITKREQHSLEVNYTEFGKDATVFWSKNRKIDLAFKNPSDHPVYIVASVQSDPDNRKRSIAKVSIYGLDLENVTYVLEAKTVEVLPPPEEPDYVKDKKQEYVTYTDQEKVVSKAEEGYLIESYRVKYVDGVEVERALLYIDRYEPKPKTIYVGIKEREK